MMLYCHGEIRNVLMFINETKVPKMELCLFGIHFDLLALQVVITI